MVFVVKYISVIFRKIKTILNFISFKRYFSHSEKSMLNLSLAIPGPDVYTLVSNYDSSNIEPLQYLTCEPRHEIYNNVVYAIVKPQI